MNANLNIILYICTTVFGILTVSSSASAEGGGEEHVVCWGLAAGVNGFDDGGTSLARVYSSAHKREIAPETSGAIRVAAAVSFKSDLSPPLPHNNGPGIRASKGP